MRRRIIALLAGAGIWLSPFAAAQAQDSYAQLCVDPDPDVRLLACSVIIQLGQETGEALADAFTSRGTAHLVMGDAGRAIEDFDHALALAPDRVLVFGYRANAYLAKGDNDGAIADFDRAIQLDPDYIDALYGRAGAYRAKGDNERAIENYNRVIDLQPDDQEAIAYRGIAYRAKNDIDRAIADFDRLIRLNPNDAGALNLRGGAYRDKGDADRAIADFDQSLRLDPDNVSVLNNRGFTELMAGRFTQAGTDFARSVTLQPAYAYHALWLNLARRKAGQPDAEEFSRNAARLDLNAWPGPVILLYGGQTTADDVRRAAAADGNAKARQDHACEAAFYIGELELLAGDANAGRNQLQEAVAACPHDFMEYGVAVRELGRLP